MHRPRAFIGIDWSGAKGPRQLGIQLALAATGDVTPARMNCPNGRAWGREDVAMLLEEMALRRATEGPVLAGIDFAFAHPFVDQGAYFPGLDGVDQPQSPSALWRLIDTVCTDAPHLYGGAMFSTTPWADYYLSPQNHSASKYSSRRRQAEIAARSSGRSPSPTFKAIGADNVATGSMAGMRLLYRLKHALGERVAIWPFDHVGPENWHDLGLILVEIFPSLYFHMAGFNPARAAAADPRFLSEALAAYGSRGVGAGFVPLGKDADEADAMISAAALRHFAQRDGCWHVPVEHRPATLSEGWIFGVGLPD
jgi:hypothetical protein